MVVRTADSGGLQYQTSEFFHPVCLTLCVVAELDHIIRVLIAASYLWNSLRLNKSLGLDSFSYAYVFSLDEISLYKFSESFSFHL